MGDPAQWIKQGKIIAILRGVESEICLRVAEALFNGGIRSMEITYDQKRPETWESTAGAIQEVARQFPGKLLVGAGTVTSPELVDLTAKYGGQFIVSPDTNVDVIRRTRDVGLVSIPGALTPSEILTAHHAGANMVKLFPAARWGVNYLKAVRSPISNVDILAVGGIDKDNINGFLAAGAVGVGVGGNLVNSEWIEAGGFHKITEYARLLTEAAAA